MTTIAAMHRMTPVPKTLIAAALALASAPALAQPQPTVALPADVQRVLDDYARAWAANDPVALAGLFTPDGHLVSVREDVGRHNAVDKVIGEQVLAARVPLADHLLQVSGRLSFEIVQKAAVAGIPIVSAVSAPSSLAVQAGERFGMTLVGFVRGDRLNVYTRPQRVVTG